MHTHATSEKSSGSSFLNKKKSQPFFAPVFVQPKLTIGPVDDPYEHEADTMADKVMRMTDHGPVNPTPAPLIIQKKCAACEEEENLHRKEDNEHALEKPIAELPIQRKCAACEQEENSIQRKESAVNTVPDVTPSVHHALQTPGHSLDIGTRFFMESRFGYDFSNVQIHNDSIAHQSTSDINALAYTRGKHIVFGAGQYQPNTYSGKELLAHELTHVVQQNNQLSRRASNGPEPVKFSSGENQKDIIQRKGTFDDVSSEDLGDDGTAGSCPRPPTKEGDKIPNPDCPVATHAGSKEEGRFEFCADSSKLTDPEQLDDLQQILKNNFPSTRFLIHGYASMEGDPAYNFHLACHRANRIAHELEIKIRQQGAGKTKELQDAEIKQRIETASQGPTKEFGVGHESNRIAIVYAQTPGGKADTEPACKDAPRHIGDIKPEINCDPPTIDLDGSSGSSERRHFQFCLDSDVLAGEDASSVKKFAFKQAANATFVVHGFSSKEGNADYNQRLSCHRALRIARELINAGVQPSQIREVSGIGETDKFFPGESEDARSFNRVAVVLAEQGAISLLKDGPNNAKTPQQKQALLDQALDRINTGQYQLAADAYISFWTCGKTGTIRQAVERLHILLPDGNEDELIREKANGREEGQVVNTVQLSNTAFHADNPIECIMGRLIDMAFHHSVVDDAQLSPDLTNPAIAGSRHLAGLHLIDLAGLTACTGKHAQAGGVPGRSDTGIDEPLAIDPREKMPPPLCAQAPQPTRLLTPPKGAKESQAPDFKSFLDKPLDSKSGNLTGTLEGDSSSTREFVIKGSVNMRDLSAQATAKGNPDTFKNYEVGLIQSITNDFTLAEYNSGKLVSQKLPVPVKTAAGRRGTQVPDPWMSLTASAIPDSSGQVQLSSGFNLDTEIALLSNFFDPNIAGKDLLDTWQRHTNIATWLVRRRLGSPLDRFSVIFMDGLSYEINQNFKVNILRLHGDLNIDEKVVGGESEKFLGTGSFQAFQTSSDIPDPGLARFGNPVAGSIDIKRQFEKIIEPANTTESGGMDKAQYAAVVKNILDNLVIFDTEEDLIKGQNGKVVPRLGFVFSPLSISISIDRASGRLLPFLGGDPNNLSVIVENAALGINAKNHLAKAHAIRLGKRDFLDQGQSVVLKPSAIPGNGKTGVINIELSPLFQEKDLSKDASVLHDMAELWACSEFTTSELDPREFGIVYWMDRDQALHRIPEDGIFLGEPEDFASGTITTQLPCGPELHGAGFGLGHVHTHPIDDSDAPLPSTVDQKKVRSGECGNKFYIVSEPAVVAYFSKGDPRLTGKRKSTLPPNVKCDPTRWRQVKKG